MRIIAVATIKGGVGKTVLSTHIAAGLARSGKRTLLMDLDPQGHATSLAGVDANPQGWCVGDVLLRGSERTLDEIIVRDVRDNLDVAPAVLRMTSQERELYTWALRLSSVLRAVESMHQAPEAVVIDCPPHPGGFTEAALHAADLTLAPLPALAGSIQGVLDLVSIWTEMKDGRAGDIAGVVNMLDGRTSLTNQQVLTRLNDLDIATLQTKVPKAEAINQAALAQKLIYDRSPSHPVVNVLERLVEEVWELASRVQQPSESSNPFDNELSHLAEWMPTQASNYQWNISSEALVGEEGYSIVNG